MLALLLVAGSLGMSNFAASIAIGLSGVDQTLRVRIACAFGLFEAGMPVIGLLLGRELSHTLRGHSQARGAGRIPDAQPAGAGSGLTAPLKFPVAAVDATGS
jgi:hypothetical protein